MDGQQAPVVVAGSQVQWGVPTLILDIGEGIGLQQQLTQLSMPKLRRPVQQQLPTLHEIALFSCTFGWKAAKVACKAMCTVQVCSRRVYTGLTVLLLSGLLPCNLLSTSQMSCFTGCSSKSAAYSACSSVWCECASRMTFLHIRASCH